MYLGRDPYEATSRTRPGIRYDVELDSEAFDDGDPLPPRFAHDRENVSPPLDWEELPVETLEVAILCEDPDAPGGVFPHWVMAGIDPSLVAIEEGSVPPMAVLGVNGFGELGWGGPEPPVGDPPHRYIFTLFACDDLLLVGEGMTADDLKDELEGKAMAQGQILGTYQR
jgi:Raf kinase inhibitor-like YbhB/YbcL family protein